MSSDQITRVAGRTSVPAGPGGADSPPFRLPAEHLAAALVFWGAGALGLVWIAPLLAQGLFPLPRVIAVTHLFTLGWITTSILGALYQFFPVALRAPVRSQWLAHLTFLLYVPGLAVFVVGNLAGTRTMLLVGAFVFGTGLVLFLGNLAATLLRVRLRDTTWWAFAGAGVFLFATVALGLVLAGNLHSGFLGESRFLALGVHLHIAIVGWVFLIMIGVGRHLLPMFLLSHGGSEWPGKLAVLLVGSGTMMLLALHHVIPLDLYGFPGALIAAGTVAFLVQGALYFRHRKKPRLDPGMWLAGVGLAVLAFALLLAPVALGRGVGAPRIVTGYVATLILGISLFVAGHYYKILPFLVWYHRFGPLTGKRPVPRVIDLYGEGIARAAVVLLVIGVLGVSTGILAGIGSLVRAGASAYATGAGIEIVQMCAVARRRPE